jgi:hypothetical protein
VLGAAGAHRLLARNALARRPARSVLVTGRSLRRARHGPVPTLPQKVGTKLLATEVRIASGLAFKAARGNTLSR